jgi:GMP reductase
MPANMKAVIDEATYNTYLKAGVIPIMHRFNSDIGNILRSNRDKWKAICVGVKQEDRTSLHYIAIDFDKECWPDCICIDVAHGHSDRVAEMISFIKKVFNNKKVFVIAGNVTTPDAVKFLQNAGADAIKVGIGPGQVCSTKNKTGFHIPMFTAVNECAKVAKVPIIADGGIRENGDVAKALVAGATFVMVGGMFASCSNSPATIVNGKKLYYGSASAYNKGHNNNVEGFATELNTTMTIEDKVRELKQDLQSAISYAGGVDLSALHYSKVNYVTLK